MAEAAAITAEADGVGDCVSCLCLFLTLHISRKKRRVQMHSPFTMFI